MSVIDTVPEPFLAIFSHTPAERAWLAPSQRSHAEPSGSSRIGKSCPVAMRVKDGGCGVLRLAVDERKRFLRDRPLLGEQRRAGLAAALLRLSRRSSAARNTPGLQIA